MDEPRRPPPDHTQAPPGGREPGWKRLLKGIGCLVLAGIVLAIAVVVGIFDLLF